LTFSAISNQQSAMPPALLYNHLLPLRSSRENQLQKAFSWPRINAKNANPFFPAFVRYSRNSRAAFRFASSMKSAAKGFFLDANQREKNRSGKTSREIRE